MSGLQHDTADSTSRISPSVQARLEATHDASLQDPVTGDSAVGVLPEGDSGRFRRVAVVGAGLMGGQLAGVFAAAGFPVVLSDVQEEALERGLRAAVRLAAENSGSPSPIRADADATQAVRDVDLVIEAVPENLALKKRLFAEMAAVAPSAILSSNSSVLPISDMAEGLPNPDLAVGMHWWNPPDLIPIVEIVQGRWTALQVVADLIALLRTMGKLPVWVRRDVPGFIGNRLQHALWREAVSLVGEGVADATTVDLVVRNTIGLRLAEMGPLENADFVGLDLTQAIHEVVLPSLERDTQPHRVLRDLVSRSNLGSKSGRGFFEWWPGAREATAARLRSHVAQQVRQRRNSSDRVPGKDGSK